MNNARTPLLRTAAIAVASFLGALAVTFVFPYVVSPPPNGPPSGGLVPLARFRLVFTTYNLFMLLALTGIYVRLYRQVPNKYALSLIVMSFALVLHAFSSNPAVHILLGFRPRPDIGVFAFLPDIFVGVAIVVLIYQSQT